MPAGLPDLLRCSMTLRSVIRIHPAKVALTLTAALAPLGLAALPAGASTSQVEHWGAFFGNGSANNDELLVPTPLSFPAPVVQVASSNSSQYALLSNGAVYAWGLGGAGELGDGGTADEYTTPVKVTFPAGVTIASLPTDAMPYNTGMAIDTTGHAWGWGQNLDGSLCLGNSTVKLKPVKLPFSDVTQMSGAGGHALYEAGGILYACGTNNHGQLGDDSTTPSERPVQVRVIGSQPIQTLVTSASDSGALLADGAYYDWGYDGQGEIGDGVMNVDATTPTLVDLPSPVTDVAQGASSTSNGQTVVLLSDGSLRAWGDDQYGQLGDAKTMNEDAPIVFLPPAGVTYATLASGGGTSYAISTTGAVYAWGQNSQGQVGNGTTTGARRPVEVESGASQISATALDVVTS